jgi:two-component system, cell cycle sensor histidine kinase and response regulator CckA
MPKSPPRAPDSLLPRWLFSLWLLLAAVLGGLAVLLIRAQGRDLQAQWEARLNVHVEDRAGTLRVWLQERRGDAEMAAAFPPVRRLFGAEAQTAAGSSPAAGAPSIADELYAQLAHAGGYAAVAAYDQSGRVVASSKNAPSDPGVAAAAVECARLGAPMIRRIPHGATTTDYSLAFLQPIPGAGASGSPGAVALSVEPETVLFPLLTRKLFEARTEELYLSGSVGGRIESLSPRKLVPIPGRPLKADDSSRVAAAALRRPSNLGEFTDNRGERVIAATRLIPETGWGLVAKVDRAEVVPRLRPQSLWVLLAAAGIFGCVTAAGLAWRRHVSANYYRTLSERDSRYRSLLERTREGVIGEIDNRLVFANPAALRMFGLTDEREFLGRPFLDFVAPESREKLLEIRRRREAGGTYERYEILALQATGGRFELELTPVAIDFEGRPAVGATLRDVTEKNRAAAAERQYEKRYRLLFERNLAGVFRSTAGGRMLDVNEACARIFGYTIAEFLRQDASVLYPAPELRAAFLERLRRNKSLRNEELALRRRDGSDVSVLLNANLVEDARDPQESVIEGTVLDITERKRAEEERERLERRLMGSQKMEAVGQLAGGIAHDFNNLLTSIAGYSELLIEGLPSEDPRRGHAEEIRKAGQRAAALTRQLLAFSRRQVLEPKVLDLNSVVEGMEGMLRSMLGEHIRLVTVKSPDLCRVRADPSQVEQAILNLVVNARDAMPSGGELSIETGTAEHDAALRGGDFSPEAGGYCMLAVSDTGIGMTSEVKARLFEPFFTTKALGKGTGLGLSTTYGIVKQSGGYIWCDSEPGRGTSFKIYLPRVELPVEKPPAQVVVPLARHGGEKILLVEDEPEVRLLVQKLLKIQGYDVIAAAAPDEALSIVRHLTHAIDLMVTDVVMPGMSGRQLADLLASTHPDMKVLFISGYTDDSILQHGVLSPGTAFLQKPFTPAALARKVRDVLESPFAAAAGVPPSS